MPELPEVETVRRDLENEVVGQQVAGVEVTGARTVRRYGAAALTDGVEGREIVAVRRHGKYLLLDLDNEAVLIVHLRMSGMLLWTPSVPESELPHTHVRLHFTSDAQL